MFMNMLNPDSGEGLETLVHNGTDISQAINTVTARPPMMLSLQILSGKHL